MTSFIYLDAPAGSGKSESLLHCALNEVQGFPNVLYVAPTNNLLDSLLPRYEPIAEGRPVLYIEKITAENGTTTKPVVQRLHEALNDPPDPEYVCFATHEAVQQLKRTGPLTDPWTLIIDEVPSAVKSIQLTFGETHHLLTEHLHLATPDEEYSLLECKDKAAVQKIATNKGEDQLLHVLREAAQILSNPSFAVFVKSDHYRKLLEKQANTIHLFACLKPSYVSKFKKVIIAGANFKDSLLYHVWSRLGVVFKEDQGLSEHLRFNGHENGARLTIHCTTLPTWSISSKEKAFDENTLFQHVLAKAKDMFGKRRFLYSSNRSDQDALFSDTSWKRLPAVAHGLNDYQDFHGVLAFGAFKRSPPEYAFLQWLGLSGDQITRATHFESIYQTVARCSLRDPKATERVDVFVPDMETAQYLQTKWPGSSVQIHDGWIPEHFQQSSPRGRPKLHSSPKNCKSHSRKKRNIEKAIEATSTLLESPSSFASILESVMASHNLQCDDNTYSTIGNNVAQKPLGSPYSIAYGMQFNDIWSAKASKLIELPTDHFIAYLKQKHDRLTESKTKNEIITPALYAALNGKEVKRKKPNVVLCSGIWLDFDAGNIDPQDVANALPGLRIVAFNTYSSKPGNCRWRAYIPTSTAMAGQAYDLIAKDIAHMLKEQLKLEPGWLDEGKLHSASPFFLPCQAAAGAELSFFIDFNENRKPLNALEWLQDMLDRHQATLTAPAEEPEEDIENEISDDHIGSVDEAWARWERLGGQPGQGNREFFILNLNLLRAGVDDVEREKLLEKAADMAHSPEDRRRDIPRLMKWTVSSER